MTEAIGTAIITILAALVVNFLIPYIKAKTTKEQRETAVILVRAAVLAAEQIFNKTGQGQEKKIYVLNFLQSRGLKITEAELDVLIEAAVKEFNMRIDFI